MKFFKKGCLERTFSAKYIFSNKAIIANIEFLSKVDLIGKKYEIIQSLESKNIFVISNSKISKS